MGFLKVLMSKLRNSPIASSQEDDEWSRLPRSARLTDWTFSAKIVINIRFLLRLHSAGAWLCTVAVLAPG